MNTRMEKVTEDVALTTLRSVGAASEPPLEPEALKEAFRAKWPTQNSQRPMNDAINAAIAATADGNHQPGQASWKTLVENAWYKAVEETVREYFETARYSFEKGESLEGVEALTDAVRATLGHIAATRHWPHCTDDDMYSIAAALASGSEWPETMEEFDRALENASEEGKSMRVAFAASMGRPDTLKFGVYAGNPSGPQNDGLLFATTTIELANRLAKQAAP